MDKERIPARYIGNYAVHLQRTGGPFQNIDGSARESLVLNPGDTLMMPAEEILGATWILDPTLQNDPHYLGVGRVVRDEHAGLQDAELMAMGYQFHQGRPDFEPVEEGKSPRKSRKKDEEQQSVVEGN